MSPPIWLRDPNIKEKKHLKVNQIRNFSTPPNKKINENAQTVADLLSELQSLLSENAKLQSDNSMLMKEVANLHIVNDNLIEDIKYNKEQFENDLNRLQEDIKLNETHLIDNSKKCLVQQKKHIDENTQLKSENEKLKFEIEKNASEMEKIKRLESDKKVLQLSYNTVKSQNEDNTQKANRYKNKLKYAITIINDLNSMLMQQSKKHLSTTQTQTEDPESKSSPIQETPTSHNCTTVPHHTNLESEKLLLSDIFFKSKSFCDNELVLFNEADSIPNLNDLKFSI